MLDKNIICITGGPCAGKQDLLTDIKKEFPSIPIKGNIAVEMQREGIPIGSEFQEELLYRQLELEKEMEWGIIVRGIADIYAYGNDPSDVPIGVLNQYGNWDCSYSAVYYLRSYAIINPEWYYRESNNRENIKEAREQDKKSLLYNYFIYGHHESKVTVFGDLYEKSGIVCNELQMIFKKELDL